jgi:glyoxylase-like metal-dependent hydrolase (beta-lactamase superfamily II)
MAMTTAFFSSKTRPLRAAPLLGAVLGSVTLNFASFAVAETPPVPPGIVLQGGAAYSFTVGDVRITALSDGTVPQDLHDLLRDTTNEKTDALLNAGFLVNPVEASINAFLFKLDGRVILVDTGSGQLFPPGYGGKLTDSLAAAGVKPEQITDVLLTHAHDDHMGGLMRDGHLAFPNATIHLGKPDADFFLNRENSAKSHYDMKYFDEFFTAVKPYVDAGKVKTFEGTAQIFPGVTATIHAGHTPGSAFYTVESKGQEIVFVGDIIHVGAVQFPQPRITITYDVDRKEAAEVRAGAFTDFARSRTLIAVPHISFPGVGHIRAVKGGYEWVPIAYGNR